MCDLNWCPVCDQAISCESDSLYCSVDCFSKDATRHSSYDSFQTFLLPKAPLVCSLRSTASDYDLPKLSASVCTSSLSLYTRRSSQAQDVTNTYNIKKSSFDIYDDDDSIASCCYYCEYINYQQDLSHNNNNIKQLQQPHPLHIPISLN